jgi:hypothetical protein
MVANNILHLACAVRRTRGTIGIANGAESERPVCSMQHASPAVAVSTLPPLLPPRSHHTPCHPESEGEDEDEEKAELDVDGAMTACLSN